MTDKVSTETTDKFTEIMNEKFVTKQDLGKAMLERGADQNDVDIVSELMQSDCKSEGGMCDAHKQVDEMQHKMFNLGFLVRDLIET